MTTALGAAAPVAAQNAASSAAPHTTQFPTTDANLERIWRIGMDSSQIQPLAQALFDSVGPRLTGGPGLRAASDWIIHTYS